MYISFVGIHIDAATPAAAAAATGWMHACMHALCVETKAAAAAAASGQEEV